MATLGDIDLGNCAWVNEFAGSSLKNDVRMTEDGRKYVFQSAEIDAEIEYYVEITSYATLASLEALRNAGSVSVLTMNDDRAFDVILNRIEAKPPYNLSEYVAGDKFFCTLFLIKDVI